MRTNSINFRGGPVPFPNGSIGGPTGGGVSDTDDDTIGGASSSLSCSATAGGTFTTAQTVTLSCSAAATIRYCLSSTATCCSPFTAGTIYSAPLTVGSTEGTYCLSYYGSVSGELSNTGNRTYVINTAAPDLEVAHARVRYQTTELDGNVTIDSTDFGGDAYSLLQVNLQNQDPGPSGLNLDCAEIYADYVSLGADVILGPVDTSTITVGWQVENPLGLTKLVYGDNYITTLLTNALGADVLHSCATTNVVLEDFPYFVALPIEAEDGSNTIREFAGGFTPYGFFEAAPASATISGATTQTVSSQELHSGLFAVFF